MARQAASKDATSRELSEAKASLAKVIASNQQLTADCSQQLAAVREEFSKKREELEKDSSRKIADLGDQVKGLLAANEDLVKDKAVSDSLAARLTDENTALQAEVEALKKESGETLGISELEEEVAELRDEVNVLGVQKRTSDDMAKVAFQDGFCLARHQVLQRFPDLDLSFLEGLNIPEGPRWQWSKVEHLKLPGLRPPGSP
ncbi:hypothetical protein [Agrobacterium sp. ST15.13.040]|uniref:hypothetical protein n=1 Tax=Agrobacterium sp. ST15.13.040 TaxID=3017318 RepID=UPI0022EC249C